MVKTNLKSGDLVKIISGKFKGKITNIQKINLTKGSLYLQGVTREKLGKKNQKKSIFIPTHISNVISWVKK